MNHLIGIIPPPLPLLMSQELATTNIPEIVALAEVFLDFADANVIAHDYVQAMIWTQVAGSVLSTQNRELTSPRVEKLLRLFGSLLPPFAACQPTNPKKPKRTERWLHVFNQALPFGGHTAMATRWMQDGVANRTHSVAVLAQKQDLPEELRAAVRASGGKIHVADLTRSLLDRAAWLRSLAAANADYVVLHIDVEDVIALSAFAAAGGPPVFLVNHAAHIYWNGAANVDVIVNCRGSKLEAHWTQVYRNAARCATVPIPLALPEDNAQSETLLKQRRGKARERLGIPQEAVFILTSGDSYKFTAMDELDFIAACEDLLRQMPEIFIGVIGPAEDERWAAARERTGSRLRTFGRQPRSQVPLFLQAADVYIEGFPFGSTTALLEAGIRAIPVVLSPAQCPPPYGTDGIAVDNLLIRAASLEDYKSKVLDLCRNEAERTRLGRQLRDSIVKHHTGAGWRNYVEQAILAAPKTHSLQPISPPVPTEPAAHLYWAAFKRASAPWLGQLAENYIWHAIDCGARPVPLDQNAAANPSQLATTVLAEFAKQYSHHLYLEAVKKSGAADPVPAPSSRTRTRIKAILSSLGPAGEMALRLVRRIKTRREAQFVRCENEKASKNAGPKI